MITPAYICSQEQATPKSNTNGSATLPKGKSSSACQKDYLVVQEEWKNKILSKKIKNKKDLKRELNRNGESVKFYTGRTKPCLFQFNLMVLIQLYTKKR